MSAACASLYSLQLKWPSQICLFAALWYFFILLLTCFWELFWHFLAIKRYSKRVLIVPKNCQERFSSWMLKCKVYDGSGHLMYWVRQQKINISRNWWKSFDILKGIVKMTTEQQLFDRTWKELWTWFRDSAKTTLRLFNILTFKKIFPTLKKLYYIFFINLCYLLYCLLSSLSTLPHFLRSLGLDLLLLIPWTFLPTLRKTPADKLQLYPVWAIWQFIKTTS